MHDEAQDQSSSRKIEVAMKQKFEQKKNLEILHNSTRRYLIESIENIQIYHIIVIRGENWSENNGGIQQS